MTIAEQLRNSVNIEKELPTLRKVVINRIKNDGKYRVICDTHIKRNDPNWAIQYKYWSPICEWAHKEGLKTSCEHNSHGVKLLVITM